MLRRQLFRQLHQPKGLSCLNTARTFASSAPRSAEVELTIGTSGPWRIATRMANISTSDGRKVSIEGQSVEVVPTGVADQGADLSRSRLIPHSSMREGGGHHSPLLLP